MFAALASPIRADTPPDFKVAFIGDGYSLDVLRLIKDQGARMVIHSGDFDYADNPDHFERRIDSVLGPDFPYFISVGNHDLAQWGGLLGYKRRFDERWKRVPGAACEGDYGVNSACAYEGLFFILSGAGSLGDGHEDYIRRELARSSALWEICSWHKNQRAMQVGKKADEVGWGPYNAALEGGAIIATAHEHSYHRTKTLIDLENQRTDLGWPDPGLLRVEPGATFVFVSGLAGNEIRPQSRCESTSYPYGCRDEWAKIYAADQGAKPGALFITFHVDGDPRRARGEFINVDGEVVDRFTVVRPGGGPTVSPPPAPPRAAGSYAFPNPFRPDQGHDGMTFADLPEDARIRIHAVTGELVRELAASGPSARWDGTNASGAPVASGVYLAFIETGGARQVLKLAVVR